MLIIGLVWFLRPRHPLWHRHLIFIWLFLRLPRALIIFCLLRLPLIQDFRYETVLRFLSVWHHHHHDWGLQFLHHRPLLLQPDRFLLLFLLSRLLLHWQVRQRLHLLVLGVVRYHHHQQPQVFLLLVVTALWVERGGLLQKWLILIEVVCTIFVFLCSSSSLCVYCSFSLSCFRSLTLSSVCLSFLFHFCLNVFWVSFFLFQLLTILETFWHHYWINRMLSFPVVCLSHLDRLLLRHISLFLPPQIENLLLVVILDFLVNFPSVFSSSSSLFHPPLVPLHILFWHSTSGPVIRPSPFVCLFVLESHICSWIESYLLYSKSHFSTVPFIISKHQLKGKESSIITNYKISTWDTRVMCSGPSSLSKQEESKRSFDEGALSTANVEWKFQKGERWKHKGASKQLHSNKWQIESEKQTLQKLVRSIYASVIKSGVSNILVMTSSAPITRPTLTWSRSWNSLRQVPHEQISTAFADKSRRTSRRTGSSPRWKRREGMKQKETENIGNEEETGKSEKLWN